MLIARGGAIYLIGVVALSAGYVYSGRYLSGLVEDHLWSLLQGDLRGCR